MADVTIYHNPRCSKSRQTLALLEERGVEPKVVPYLEQPPSADELAELVRKLGASARDILRTGEAEYKDMNLGDDALTEEELLRAMAAAPRLIQRPIVVKGEQARIGRPPEAVLEILA